MDIQIGTNVQVKVVKQPTNEAAIKTLRRVLAKDESIKAEKKRLDKVADSKLRYKTRGGRPWIQRMVKIHPAQGVQGEQGVIFASADVINDLKSVSRFIEVTPA
ncbi:MAG: hypothetical protein CMJ19_15700 [Phycisphaeraceae bacterium]|nr:hypothetical protein [Phycisphaeraceae bacterium]